MNTYVKKYKHAMVSLRQLGCGCEIVDILTNSDTWVGESLNSYENIRIDEACVWQYALGLGPHLVNTRPGTWNTSRV